MNPKISVIIPNFNRAELIGETIKNMLQQTLSPHEVIVVDDGSTDNSVKVVRSFGDQVILVCQENSGPAVARNVGLERATGDFVQFIDSDDLCTLNKLRAQVEALIRSGADFTYGPWLKTQLSNHQAIYSELPLQQAPLPPKKSPLAWFLRGWVIVFQACMFRRKFIDRVGRYRSDLMPSEDSEFLFRMLKSRPQCVYVPDALVLYRVHPAGQITFGGMSEVRRKRDWLKYTEIVARELELGNIVSSRLDRLFWEATVWKAQRELLQLGEGVRDEKSYGFAKATGVRLLVEASRVRAGLRSRIAGTRMPPWYKVSRLTESQEFRIRELGYEPIRSAKISG